MRDPDAQLKKLVALKRQKAEQRVLALQQVCGRAEMALAEAKANLRAADNPELDFTARSLALQGGRVEGLIAQVRARESAVSAAAKDLAEAREALKWVLYSEDRLDDLSG
ncbi:MAG: hypothetical protein MRY64_08020 [Hyphomonadaceae bacterium]|nr:hypothetical protein [Hyphomonadaceae bacterium]